MRTHARWISGITLSLLGGTVTILAIALITASIVYASHPTFQWVIGATGLANADDNSQIALTGNGTFRVKPGNPHVTGGGTWTTATDSGTYTVTDLVSFELAPGADDDPTIRAGLAVLRIEYSDGEEGILIVSCHLDGTPDSVSEGISASKGYVNYWKGFRSVGGSGAFFRALD